MPAESRTCPTLPGVEVFCAVWTVWIESTITGHRFHLSVASMIFFDRRLAEEVNPVVYRAEPPGPHGDLPRRFLSRGIEDRTRGGQLVRRLQEQGRLAMPGSPPTSTTPRERVRPQHASKLGRFVEIRGARSAPTAPIGTGAAAALSVFRPAAFPRLFFRVGVPGIALGAAPEPLVRLITAFETGEDDCFLGHWGSDCSNRVQTLYEW